MVKPQLNRHTGWRVFGSISKADIHILNGKTISTKLTWVPVGRTNRKANMSAMITTRTPSPNCDVPHHARAAERLARVRSPKTEMTTITSIPARRYQHHFGTRSDFGT